jgi:CBS-domain-containing membrane protein
VLARFTAAPVVDTARRLVGIVGEADLVRGRVVPDGWVVAREPDPTVEEVMTQGPATGRPDDDLADDVATRRFGDPRSGLSSA